MTKTTPESYHEESSESGGESHRFLIDEVLHKGKTKWQEVAIYRTREYGKMLVLDGHTQSAEHDEFAYHEALVQPVMTVHPDPRRVLVIGGGEGATLREVLRHPSVEKAVMIDIDEELIGLCKEHLPEWHQGAFDHPKTEVRFIDGFAYIENSKETFDVIIIDLVDEFGDNPIAAKLYSEAFYSSVKARLAPGGILVVQAMVLSQGDHEYHNELRSKLHKLFKHTRSYSYFIAAFWSDWGWVIASDTVDPLAKSAAEIDATLKSRGVDKELRFYDGLTHQGLFGISKDLRKAFEERER